MLSSYESCIVIYLAILNDRLHSSQKEVQTCRQGASGRIICRLRSSFTSKT